MWFGCHWFCTQFCELNRCVVVTQWNIFHLECEAVELMSGGFSCLKCCVGLAMVIVHVLKVGSPFPFPVLLVAEFPLAEWCF